MEQKFSFKKLLSVFLVCAMLLSSFTFLAFAEEATNVALGKEYTAPEALGGYNASLTDGVKDPGDSEYTNAVWAGYSYLVPSYAGYHSFVIDLGESMSLAQVSVAIASSALGNGIGSANTSFEVLVSEDGENWTSVGTVASGEDDGSVNFYEYSVNFSGNGRYVEVRVVRDGIVIAEDEIDSLRRFKDDVKEVASGYECGVGLAKYSDIKEGDIFEAFIMEEYRD